MKSKFFLFPLLFLTIFAGCISSNRLREEYFGYNNEPKYDKNREKTMHNAPHVYSRQTKQKTDNHGDVYIINNYYPYPYAPNYVRPYDPFDIDLFLYFGNNYYDPFWNSYVIYIPYTHRHHYVYYPYPYWDYWWDRRHRIIYVPYDVQQEKPRERSVRDFGPSRSDYDYDKRETPTKEARSSSRSEGRNTQVSKTTDIPKTNAEPVKTKLPEKPSKTDETPKSDSKTKQDRSQTRPR
ncbi:MAG: hypothetical protein ACK42Z_08145 [Candidatus Kapaibacteriota bacterium]